ncbi:MAG: hypothetical protein HY255_02190 [Betaproteobacteria bacterium]|nr:hypothetical protein [Betaproteobacteria bacterium]
MASTPPPVTPLPAAALADLLASLRALDLKLTAIRTPDLQGDDLGKWFQLSNNVAAAIEYLERETLASINASMGKEAAAIAKAIVDSEKALRNLNDRASVLRIVGGVANMIGSIAALA